jgi:hypothetical protein
VARKEAYDITNDVDIPIRKQLTTPKTKVFFVSTLCLGVPSVIGNYIAHMVLAIQHGPYTVNIFVGPHTM